jgi:hypothetical protein
MEKPCVFVRKLILVTITLLKIDLEDPLGTLQMTPFLEVTR